MNRILKTSSIVFLTIFILTITINKTQLINIEGFYSGFYIIWYTLLSNLVLYLKISVGDLIYILSPLFIIIYFLRIERRRDRFYFIIKIPIIVYCLFYWSWGFNYNKKSEFELLKTNEYSIEDLYFTTEHLIKKTNDLQIIISKSKEKKAVSNLMFDDIKNECIKSIKKSDWMFNNNKTNGFPVKKSIFSTPLSYMGFSGYINPFTLEANINYNIPDISIPFTISHEIAHQLGYAFEDEANFIAIETLSKSKNNYLRYSGNLMAVQYLLSEIKKTDNEKHKHYIKELNIGVIKNIQEKKEYYLKYQNKYKSFFKKNYDIFLKNNNQKAGINTYSLVVDLLINNYQSKI
tara:strand:- start:15 stop:1058 length:1044 start_codon:yes stop_codon:yes gene_type:complete